MAAGFFVSFVVFVLFMPLEATLSQSIFKHQGVEGLPFAMAVPSWWNFKEGQDGNCPTPPKKKKTVMEALACATGYMQYFVNEVSSFSDR